jgi:hypothetical protein
MARVPKGPLTAAAWTLGALVMLAPTLIALRLTSGNFGAATADATSAPVAAALQSSPASATSSPQPSVASHSVQVNAPIESWAQALRGNSHEIPRQLDDGRWFEPAALTGPHAVVGIVRDNSPANPRSGLSGVVVIDPATARVTSTVALDANVTTDDGGAHSRSDVVGPSGANADWVSWLHGRLGDDDGITDATVYAQNVKTGRRLVLGTSTSGDSSQLTPTISGDDVMWADRSAVHVYSLSERATVYTLPLTDPTSTFVDAFHWPWLSYQVRMVGEGTSVSHVVDVRSGSDQVVSGTCDGTWCATTAGADPSDAVGLVAQGIASESRTIASNLGGFGGVAALSDGFVLWTDTDPYAPGYGRSPDVAALPLSATHTYLYDITADRDIEMPAARTSFISGGYVVWEDQPNDLRVDGTLHFAALADIR